MKIFARFFVWAIAISLVVLPIVAVLNGWLVSQRWALSRLLITGQLHEVSANAIRQAVLPFAKAGFFAVDLSSIQHAIETIPWVEQARVGKKWPDRLEVYIREYQPFARWGQDAMISQNGQVFSVVNNTPWKDFPLLSGPDENRDDMIGAYYRVTALFEPLHLSVHGVFLDQTKSWSIDLTNGMHIVLGQQDIFERLQRFVTVLPTLLAQNNQQIISADLRYPDGFALQYADVPSGSLSTLIAPVQEMRRVSQKNGIDTRVSIRSSLEQFPALRRPTYLIQAL